MTTKTTARRPISRTRAGAKRAARIWNKRRELADAAAVWWATPASPCITLDRSSPEFVEIEARYLGRAA